MVVTTEYVNLRNFISDLKTLNIYKSSSAFNYPPTLKAIYMISEEIINYKYYLHIRANTKEGFFLLNLDSFTFTFTFVNNHKIPPKRSINKTHLLHNIENNFQFYNYIIPNFPNPFKKLIQNSCLVKDLKYL